jgi:hypothetical protein
MIEFIEGVILGFSIGLAIVTTLIYIYVYNDEKNKGEPSP